ncbi:MAG: hypothetical protein RL026_2062 [Pseudomonadota bacterium]|jgi:two-component system chemotaxis sensor kinase CheA
MSTAGAQPALAAIELLLAQFAEELAFAAPGSDAGLLGLNAVLMDLEQSAAELPQVLAEGLPEARQVLDGVLAAGAQFNAAALASLADWLAWGNGAVLALRRGQPVPARAAATPVDAEPAVRLNLPGDVELLREFHAESVELLQVIEQGLLTLEDNPGDTATINAVFRAFHTFKGSAGFLQLGALRDLAHELESLLDAVRAGRQAVHRPLIEVVLAGKDALAAYTRHVGAQLAGDHPGTDITVPTSALRARLQAGLRGEWPVATPATAAATPAAADGTPEPVAERESAPAEQSSFVKLDISKLDALINLVGELVIAQSMVVEHRAIQGAQDDLSLVRNLRQLRRITRELQHGVTSLRMVPVRSLFRRMHRLVRDLAQSTGKSVQLVLDGEETELDRNLVEKIADPLVHMLRNAIDHGIEPAADRSAAGKPAQGTLRLTAGHQRGGIVIRLEDDGRGLDAGRIRRKAVERGLIAADALLDEAALRQLIFLPGFSTAEQVTELSGRGVGMDIVRGNIEALQGKIEVDSVVGQGTTFRIVLPLTLAIIDGLVLGVAGRRYLLPALAVRESIPSGNASLARVHGRGEMLAVRGRQVPVLRMAPFLGLPDSSAQHGHGILVIVESGDAQRALWVDELLGKQEVVIKNLGQAFAQQTLFAGGAVLGDGTVGLILDPDTLVRLPQEGRATS